MSDRLQLLMLIAEAIYFAMIFVLLRKRKLMLSYSLGWISAGIIMLIFTIFPVCMDKFFDFLHVDSPMNGLLSLCVFLILLLLIFLTSVVSKQANQLRVLSQNAALLEERLRALEDGIDKSK